MVGFIKDLSVLTENKITWEEKKLKEKKRKKKKNYGFLKLLVQLPYISLICGKAVGENNGIIQLLGVYFCSSSWHH